MAKRLSKRQNTLRKSSRRKNMKRKTMKRKTMKGGIIGMQCGNKWKNIKDSHLYTYISHAKNRFGTSTLYNIQMKIKKLNDYAIGGETIRVIIKIPNMRLKDIKELRNRIINNKKLNTILKVDTYLFKEFWRGNKINCFQRFEQIDDFFKHIVKKIQLHGNNAGAEIEIIKILQSMNKLPNNFMPAFESLYGQPILDRIRIIDSNDNIIFSRAELDTDVIGTWF